MNTRFDEMRAILHEGRYFKLVCGAGNENLEEVRKLAFVYTLGGANGFDVSASPDIVRGCVEGIDRAYALALELGREIPIRPFITVSVGMSGDHHVRKAHIVDSCIDCGKCIPVCPTDAIPADYKIARDLCIGCGNCEAVCPPKVAAVRYEHNKRLLSTLLPECLVAGAENIELHAAVPGDDDILAEWKVVCEAQPNNFVSMCLDRFHLSNHHLIQRIAAAWEISGERTMIQADGVPMSGGADDYNTTLQAIAIADVIQKNLKDKKRAYRNLPILLSGGTNGKTGELARMCGVPYQGVSIGTHARKIIKPMITLPDFYENPKAIKTAVEVAEDLVKRNLAS
jgi:ferredoxin